MINIEDVINVNEINMNIPKETTDNTNCLALTVRKEYRLALARNLFDKTTTITWKIGLGIIVLNFLNMFFISKRRKLYLFSSFCMFLLNMPNNAALIF